MLDAERIGTLLQEWATAFAFLAISWFIARAGRAWLKSRTWQGGWHIVRHVAREASRLLYIFGLKLFVATAPLAEPHKQIGNQVVFVLAVLLSFSLLRNLILRSLESSPIKQGFEPLLRNLVTVLLLLVAFSMVLRRFNYDVLSLITALGVGSLAIGLAAKETLSNMISGFTLIIDRNLHTGDRIEIDGAGGDVAEIGLRSTQIRTAEGHLMIVPNSEMVNKKILNLSMPNRDLNCFTRFKVSQKVEFPRLREICLGALQGREPQVHLMSLQTGSQEVSVRFWVQDLKDSGQALTDFHVALLAACRKEGIEIVG